MSLTRKCPQCGAEMTMDAPQGLCPACLLKGGLASQTASAATIESPKTRTINPAAGMRVRYFGDYELLEEIARGGMGAVWKAHQVSLNRTVALKMILAGKLASTDEVQRFRREAEAAANLQHPNIVAIHEVGEHDGQHYFSMDYVAGRNLADLAGGKSLPADRAARYVQVIAEAIHFAHQRGTLHRDLKPQNVLIDEHDQPRITDFGLAKIMADESGLTLSGAVMGSPSYMAPEQATGRHDQVGPHTDVYSLGAILYQLLTGRPPFLADTPVATMQAVLETEPVAPRKLNAGAPVDLETICLKCLGKEPSQRYPNAQELADDLGRFLRQEPILARPVTAVERLSMWVKRRPAVAGLAAAVAVGLMMSTYFAVKAVQRAAEARLSARQVDAARQREQDQNKALQDLQEHLSHFQPFRPVVWYDGPAVVMLHLSGTKDSPPVLTDSDLAYVKPLISLVSLELFSDAVTDAGLVHLRGLTNLTSLALRCNRITDRGLEDLKDLTKLESLRLAQTQIAGDGLRHLRGLARLRWLNLEATPVTDEGLVHLKALVGLKTVLLYSTRITDAGLQHLAALTNLQQLELSLTQVGDAGVEHLKGLTGLRQLGLRDTKVTGRSLESLQGLNNLDSLSLDSTPITDAGLEHLKGQTNLVSLSLFNTKITDAGVVHLAGLTKLKGLNLQITGITDASVEHLKGLTRLTTLNICSTRISAEGVNKLKQALPKCNIMYSQ